MKLACAILKCVNLIISLYVNLHEMSLLPNILAHLLKLNINIGSKSYMFVSFIKHVPFQPIRYLFINQIYEKRQCTSLSKCPIIATWGGTRKSGKLIAFSAKTTIYNSQYNMCSIKLWAKDYSHEAHFRSVTYNRIQQVFKNQNKSKPEYRRILGV